MLIQFQSTPPAWGGDAAWLNSQHVRPPHSPGPRQLSIRFRYPSRKSDFLAITVDPATGDTPSGTAMGIGALLWYLFSSAIALFAGGFVAGRLAGNFNGYLHGIVTWSVVTVASVLLVSSAIGHRREVSQP